MKTKQSSLADFVEILAGTHKEPTPLDLTALFQLIDNHARSEMLKHGSSPPALYLYSSDKQETTIFTIIPKRHEYHKYVTPIMGEIIARSDFDYYVMTAEGWSTECGPDGSSNYENYKHGDIRKMPLDERQEVLLITGKSADLRENRTTIYIIVRTNPENMRSKVVKLLRSVDADKSGGTLPYWETDRGSK